MIWLSDCSTPENGPTYVVPGSHRFGRPVNPSEADRKGIPMCGKAGTAVLINSNVWHRGCENKSDISRETLQITFARRIIGHKHKTIMNYQMPEHVTEGRSDILKQRMGFLQGGAYS
jgi:ectoine hydroxylase-related dioxygenase (phytanoyl-CoA dioxygenase family)